METNSICSNADFSYLLVQMYLNKMFCYFMRLIFFNSETYVQKHYAT